MISSRLSLIQVGRQWSACRATTFCIVVAAQSASWSLQQQECCCELGYRHRRVAVFVFVDVRRRQTSSKLLWTWQGSWCMMLLVFA